MTEQRYTELLEAAPPILRDELTRVQQYQPNPNEMAVSVLIAFGSYRPRQDWS